MRTAREIKAHAAEENFRITQGHMEFHCILWEEGTTEILKQNIDAFQEIGVQNMVFHVHGPRKTDAPLPPEEEKARLHDIQVQRIQELVDYVKGTDSILCIEDLTSSASTYSAEDILRLIHDCDDSENLGICLDTGHLNRTNAQNRTNQSFSEFIRVCGPRLRALHVNGNEGDGDLHLFPYSGRGVQPDWDDFMSGLKASQYEGLFNFEVPGEFKNVPLEIADMKVRYAKKLAEIMMGE